MGSFMEPLYIPLSSGPGASQVRVIPWFSTLHGSQLLLGEAKILQSQQRSLCLASFSLLPLSLSAGLLLSAPQQSKGFHSRQLWTTLTCQEYSLLSNCRTRQPLPESPAPV